MLDAIALLIFPAIVAYAAVSDILTMRISNWISLTLIAAFFVMAALAGLSLNAIGMHLAMAAAVLAVMFTFFAFGWIGGGDAKIAASIALWFGLPLGIAFLLQAAIWGGALTIVFLLLRRWPLPAGLLGVEWISRLHNSSNGIPYGVALAAAGMMVYPQSAIFRALAT